MTKDPYYKETKVHFTVDFEGLTNMCRDFWAEGEYQKALVIMTESGIPLKDAHNVIRGKLKMIQFPGGKEGVEGTLAKDNWKPNLDQCMWGKYPDPTDTVYFRMIERWGTKNLSSWNDQLSTCVAQLEKTIYWPDKERLKESVAHIPDEVREFFDYPKLDEVPTNCSAEEALDYTSPWTAESWKRIKEGAIGYQEERLEKWLQERNVPMTWSGSYPPGMKKLDVEAYVKRQLELEKITEKPKPCNPPERTGWLSPKGEMFACNYNEHRWLSELLGYDSEAQIEKEGWVKLHYTLMQPDFLLITKGNRKKKLTQKQIDALWDWANHNKVDADYLAEILEDEDDL